MVTDQLLFGGAESPCERMASKDVRTSGSATATPVGNRKEIAEGVLCLA